MRSETTSTTATVVDTRRHDLDASLARGLAWTGGVKWGTQLVTWVSTLFVARLLSPGDYGLLGMATVYLGIVTLLSEFGVGTAVLTLRELSVEQIAQLNGLALLLGFSGFALSCLIALPLGLFFRSPQLPLVVVAMSANFIISSFQSVPAALLQKDFRFRLLSLIDGTKALVLALATVLLAWFGFRYWTLVIGSVLGTLTGTLLILARRRHHFAWPRPSALHHVVRFTRHILVSRLAWYTYSNSDFVISGRVLGQAALGAYSISWNLANIPVDKITGVVNNVTPALFSAVQKEKAMLRRYLLNLTEAIALITLPVSVGLGLVADDFVLLALGSKWQAVVAPLRFLAFYVTIRSIAPIIPVVLNVVGETRFVMWNSVAAALILPGSFYVGSHWGNAGIAVTWMLAYPFFAIPLFHRAFQKIELSWWKYFQALRAAFAGTLFMVSAVQLLRWTLPATCSLERRLTLKVLTGTAAYVLIAATLNFRRRHSLVKMLRLFRSEVT